MFWVGWQKQHKRQKINWLLWRYYFSLTAKEKSFLRNIREDLRTNRRELTQEQNDWLNGLYARKVRRQRRWR
jgi:hypothetical protein